MNENWSNNRLMLNGHARPPIVLRSETEMLIAQNAHNLVWEKHRGAYDALDALKKAGGDHSEADAQWNALHAAAQREIDALITAEITAYRSERANRSGVDIEERMERLEQEIDELRNLAEEAQSTAEEALDMAQEAVDKLEAMDGDGGE